MSQNNNFSHDYDREKQIFQIDGKTDCYNTLQSFQLVFLFQLLEHHIFQNPSVLLT